MLHYGRRHVKLPFSVFLISDDLKTGSYSKKERNSTIALYKVNVKCKKSIV